MAKQIVAPSPAKIKAIGIGGGGCNAVVRMYREGIKGVEFIAANTDAQVLQICPVPTKVQLGEKLTRGLGAGGDHILGRKAGEESRDELREILSGADMVFIAAGMGGGTGTGAAPIVASIAKESGALTIGVVTKPFHFEGTHRMMVAEEGIKELTQYVDTLIIIPNDRLLALVDTKMNVDLAFKLCDDVLAQAVRAIVEVIHVPGLINLDFADIKAVMKEAGPAWLAIGKGTGQNRATDAAKAALSCPLLDVSIDGGRAALFVVTGGQSLTLHEVNEAAQIISKALAPDANIIFGVTLDESLDNQVELVLIVTGFKARVSSPIPKPAEIKELAKKLEEETDIDVPAFLRYPLVQRRRQTLSQSPQILSRTPR